MDQKTLATLEYPRILAELADLCHFNPAREKVLELVPSTDLEEVDLLQQQTAEALALITLHPGITIGGARDLRRIVADAQRGMVLEPNRLLHVKDSLVAARNLKRQFQKEDWDYPSLAAMVQRLPESLGLISKITQVISDQEEILDEASPRLGQIRNELRTLHGRLKSRMDQLLKRPEIAKHLQESIITQRNGRYVLPIKAEARPHVPGIVHDQSTSGATLYVEPQSMVDANNRFRKLELDERDEVQRILADLTARVAEQGDALVDMVETLTRLDLAFARGRFALNLNAVRPTMRPFPKKQTAGHPGVTLRLFGARHPLLDPREVVPIDLVLDDKTYALIITGPNTGGKTVTLKTVGLLVLMAQTGMHIPALGNSELSLFSNIYADIGDEQSIEQSLSTFSGHITNIINILGKMDRRSLIILDELGAGTDPQEGAALARSLMSHLLERGVTTLVTTHHPDLKAYAHATPGVVNASVEFDLDSLRPTYHLTIGLPGRSNALAIANRLGLPAEIIQTARGTLDPTDLRADDLLDEIRHQRKLAEEARIAAESARKDAEALRRQLAERIEAIEDERIDLLDEARREARKELDELKEGLEAIRAAIEQGKEPLAGVEELDGKAEAIDEVLAEPLPKRQTKIPQPIPSGPILKGQRVYLRSLGKKGQVLSVNGDDVEVQVGNIRVRARKSDLEHTAGSENPEQETVPQTKVYTPAEVESPGTELDLRGQQVHEALENLSYFLDKAFLARLPWVRIIHGMGTGKLRKAVREALRGHPQVDHFERGKEGEGGDGVTLVSFGE